MDVLSYSFNAILPILLSMALGYYLRRRASWSGEFYKQLNSLCFFLFMPVMVFVNLYALDETVAFNWRALLFILLFIPVAVLIGWIFSALFVKDKLQKGVMIQAAYRSNYLILGQALALSLGGEEALTFYSVAVGLCAVMYSLIAVIVLPHYARSSMEKPTVRQTVKDILSNPLVISSLAGLAVISLRAFIPRINGELVFSLEKSLPPLYTFLKNLSRVASPVMLIIIGANLDFSGTKKLLPQLTLGILLRLVLIPSVILGISLLLRELIHLTPVEMVTMVAVFATPVASSSAVMVGQMGGDAQLANQLVVWTSVFCLLSIFLFCALLRAGGYL